MTTRVAHCRLCQSKLSDPVLDLGMLPPCNRFSPGPDAEERYPLAVAACPRCGLVQLSTCAAAIEVVPRVPWLRYSEPDGTKNDSARVGRCYIFSGVSRCQRR